MGTNGREVITRGRNPYIETVITTVVLPDGARTTPQELFINSPVSQLQKIGPLSYSAGAQYSQNLASELATKIDRLGPGGLTREEIVNFQYASFLNKVFIDNASPADSTYLATNLGLREKLDASLGEIYNELSAQNPEYDSQELNALLEDQLTRTLIQQDVAGFASNPAEFAENVQSRVERLLELVRLKNAKMELDNNGEDTQPPLSEQVADDSDGSTGSSGDWNWFDADGDGKVELWDNGSVLWSYDPVILDLDRDGVEVSTVLDSWTFFDLDGDGFLEQSSWAAPDDGFLVIDLSDGDLRSGEITDGRELAFGLWTEADDTDLEALAAVFDTSGDGKLTSADARWAEFRIWQDVDQDGITDQGELYTLAGVEAWEWYDINGNGAQDAGEYQKLENKNITEIGLTYDDGSTHADRVATQLSVCMASRLP